MQRISQNANPAVQFLINLTKQPSALHLIGRKTKPGQHDQEYDPIPDL
jgi:hypothetical protein